MKIFADDKWNSICTVNLFGWHMRGSDKILHFAGALVGTFLVMWINMRLGFGWSKTEMFMGLFTFGFLWEVKDIIQSDGFSWKDLVCDVLGILIAII